MAWFCGAKYIAYIKSIQDNHFDIVIQSIRSSVVWINVQNMIY